MRRGLDARRARVVCTIGLVGMLLGDNFASAEEAESPVTGPEPQTAEPASLAPEPIPDLVFARMVENPVSGITRLPVANRTQFVIPPNQRVANALVLAPILPALFKNGWSLITRTVIPAVVTVPFSIDATGVPNPSGRTTGFGDITTEWLGHKMLRGKKNQFYDVAFGGLAGFPSATDDLLGTGRWLLGPELVLALSAREWVTILAARNAWSVGKERARADVNRLFLEYFLFYNLPKLFYLIYETTVTANWEALTGDRWTLPIGIGFGRHHRIPSRPRLAITTRITGLYNAVRTNTDGHWQLIATFVFWKPNPAVFDID